MTTFILVNPASESILHCRAHQLLREEVQEEHWGERARKAVEHGKEACQGHSRQYECPDGKREA